MAKISVISGNTSRGLARRIANKLDATFVPAQIIKFPDGESKITLGKIPKKSIILVGFIMLAISKFRDYRLAVISFAAIISHIAFDIWLGQQVGWDGSEFPLFSPFLVDMIPFSGYSWLFLEIFAFGVVGIITFMNRKFGKIENNSTQVKKFKNTF